MRRLIAWTLTPTSIFILLLISLRGSDLAACVQLLDPEVGSVLTVDVNTGESAFDARTTYPIPVPRFEEPYRSLISPDRRYMVEPFGFPESGPPVFDLRIGPRSANHRRQLNTDYSVQEFRWASDSKHIAFTEIRVWNGYDSLANLVIADAKGESIQREAIPDLLDDNWLDKSHDFVWSPDGAVLTMPLFRDKVGATLLWRPVNAERASYIAFPDELIQRVSWSPTSEVVLVTTADMSNTPTYHKVYFIDRTGEVIKENTLTPDYEPRFQDNTLEILEGNWSRDGQYVYLSNPEVVDIFNLRGDPVIPTLSGIQDQFWSTLPHTLLYLTKQANQRSLYALDAASGRSTLIIPALAETVRSALSFAPDQSEIVVTARGQHGGVVPHIISLNLSSDETPFGEIPLVPFSGITIGRGFPVAWSEDQRQVMIVAETSSQFILMWWFKDTNQVRQFHLAKQGSLKEQLTAQWLTNEIVFITDRQDLSYRTGLLLLDTQSSHLKTLVPFAQSAGYDLYAHDDTALTLRTWTGFNVYSLSDAQPIISVKPPIEGFVPFFNSRLDAALLYRDRNSSEATKYLFLGTANATDKIAEMIIMTQPAWSPDGEMFAFGVIENYDEGWRLKVMSRDGVLLKDHVVQTANDYSFYEQVRWTGCD